jgi:hypothetical protein
MYTFIFWFALGFLVDKVRIFPVLIGMLLGVALKILVESSFSLDVATGQMRSMYTRVTETMMCRDVPDDIIQTECTTTSRSM